ncbi:hypothetical protein FHS56_001332 [Thermonema lapsum]|uniref:Carboxypeptidase-like regulatory domain-containing protein n=1 Tax=Thermonema lapsum TaxID=28195 RepID=A0A846MQT2_9BACT|nr:DUF5686 and carboxypeptidase-like regulatory domain-containing protein [Thermonema lapsum]NIK73819.1 hypothetical protein [Thermonema lapsum]
MSKLLRKLSLWLPVWGGLTCLLSFSSMAQQITLRGKVIDGENGLPMPACNVYLKNHPYIGTSTDANGTFVLTFEFVRDTLLIEFISYQTIEYPLLKAQSQTNLAFSLKPDVLSLAAVVITPGENPAYRIIREAIKRKKQHDKRQLEAYEYESYNRIEGYVKSSDKGISKLRFVKDMRRVAAGYDMLRTTEGDTLIPVLVNEVVSRVYMKHSPYKRREDIEAQQLSGIGIEDAPTLQNILSNTYLTDYNFYRNQINILGKYFPSPLANGWRLVYDYELEDSLEVGGYVCYQLKVIPLREEDIAFTGRIWITKEDYALRKVQLHITPNANINFVRSLSIEQVLAPTQSSVWLPESMFFEVEISEFTDLIPSIVARTYSLYKNYRLNETYPNSFYEIRENNLPSNKVQEEKLMAFRALEGDSIGFRPQIHYLIDTLNRVPSVKRYTGIIKVLSTGYLRKGGIDFGHYARYYAWNNIEGHRIGFGMRTNYHLSPKWMFKSYVAYGTQDQRWKYDLRLYHVLSRKRFTIVGLRHLADIEPLIQLDQRNDLPELFIASNRFFDLAGRRPFFHTANSLWIDSRLSQLVRAQLTLQQNTLDPLYPFAYYPTPSDTQTRNSSIHTTEIIGMLRLQRAVRLTRDANFDEIDIANRNPRLTLWTIFGFKGLLNGDFQYQKVYLELAQKNANVLGIGHANYSITAGYIFSDVPYPLLRTHLGNNTPILIERAFNQMNGFEFVSDHFIAVHYAHYFEGFILNKLPLIRRLNDKLEWRLVGSLNAVWGGLRESNQALLAQQTEDGQPVEGFSKLDLYKPYVEVGYGIDNIFRFFRVDFFHRLTYLNSPQAKPFGIKFSAEIKF